MQGGLKPWSWLVAGRVAIGVVAAVVALGLTFSFLNEARLFRAESCPSLDVLSWDGNLRLIGALDQYSLFASGSFLSGLALLFRAETWPPLRDILQHIAFHVHPEGVSVVAATSISALFFALLFPSGLYILVRLLGAFRGGLAFVVFAGAVSRGHEFLRFAFSAMLETQGMFFLLWGTYFLLRLYDNRGRNSAQRSALVPWAVSLSLCGVFLTKYPYGAMLLVALVGVELATAPRLYTDIAWDLWRTHYRGWRALLAIVAGVSVVILSALGELGDAGEHARAYKTGIYLFSLFYLCDFYWMLFRRRDYLWPQLPGTMRVLQLGVFVPILAWTFAHPTRFKTVLGTQQRVIEGVGSDYFLFTLFRSAIEIPWLFAALAGLAGIGVILCWRKGEQSRLRALLIVALFLGINLALLDVSTVNRQERHIFHLLPGLIMVLLVAVFSVSNRIWQSLAALFLIGLSAHGIQLLPGIPAHAMTWGPRPTIGSLCANPAHDFVEPARLIARDLASPKPTVVINRYHETYTGLPHRALATPIDLLLRLNAVRAGAIVRNDNRHAYRSWSNFARVVVISVACDDISAALVAERARVTGATLGPVVERTYGGGAFCVREYELGITRLPSGTAEKQ